MPTDTEKKSPVRRSPSPNAGGSISRGGQTTDYAPSPYTGVDAKNPNRPNQGGSISGQVQPGLKFQKDFAGSPAGQSGIVQRSPPPMGGGGSPHVAIHIHHGGSQGQMPGDYSAGGGAAPDTGEEEQSPAMPQNNPMQPAMTPPSPAQPLNAAKPATPPVMPAAMPPPQTERANPLTGAQAPQAPGQAMGFNRAGRGTPKGQDVSSGGIGKTGISQRQFGGANNYDSYTRKLFAGREHV